MHGLLVGITKLLFTTVIFCIGFFHTEGKLLSLEQIWDEVPSPHKGSVLVDPWTAVTQQEHPHLHRPYFQIHPCHTGQVLAKTLDPEATTK